MKLRIGNIMFLLFLSSVAFPQATNRYLDKPLPQEWEEDAQIFQQVLPRMTNGGKLFRIRSSILLFLLRSNKTTRY